MFNFRHPRPVTDGRAVAVQVVQQKVSVQPETRTLVVTGGGADRPTGAAAGSQPASNGVDRAPPPGVDAAAV